MKPEEAIRIIEVAKAECEWNAPLEYQEAFDVAIEALKAQPKHDQNTPQKQPDLDTLGVKTGETCEDVISRQAAIDVVRRCSVKEVAPAYMLIDKAEVMTELMMLPSAQPEQRWIPCSERLPEPRIDVWCNSDMGQMVGYYEENVETWYGRDYLELMVTAWMPLPKPYKGET